MVIAAPSIGATASAAAAPGPPVIQRESAGGSASRGVDGACASPGGVDAESRLRHQAKPRLSGSRPGATSAEKGNTPRGARTGPVNAHHAEGSSRCIGVSAQSNVWCIQRSWVRAAETRPKNRRRPSKVRLRVVVVYNQASRDERGNPSVATGPERCPKAVRAHALVADAGRALSRRPEAPASFTGESIGQNQNMSASDNRISTRSDCTCLNAALQQICAAHHKPRPLETPAQHPSGQAPRGRGGAASTMR